jgi:dTDP-4-amino-4,6-dideoxygalactose transaminase
MYYLLLPDEDHRTAFIEFLRRKEITTVFHYVPLHSSPMGQLHARTADDMHHTQDVSSRLVRLPLWIGLEDHLAFVISEVIAASS